MTGEAPERERWSSRLAFYFTAVGAAVGFGNIWRFPSLAADYGGGAFFVPYLMALFLIGIPILILEISLGQVRKQSWSLLSTYAVLYLYQSSIKLETLEFSEVSTVVGKVLESVLWLSLTWLSRTTAY